MIHHHISKVSAVIILLTLELCQSDVRNKFHNCYREVFDTTPDQLRAYEKEDNSLPCDVCVNNGVKDEPADVYCSTCDKRFCTNHQQVSTECKSRKLKICCSESICSMSVLCFSKKI